MLRLLYSALLYVVAPLAFIATALRGLRDPSYRDRLPERLGFTQAAVRGPADLDSAGLGRGSAGCRGAGATARVAIRSIRSWSRRRLRRAAAGALVRRFGAPCLSAVRPAGSMRRFLDRTTPVLAIIMEREIWPNLYRACFARRIPILLASARISDRSGQRHLRFADCFATRLRAT